MVTDLRPHSGQPNVTTVEVATAWVGRLAKPAVPAADDVEAAYNAAEEWVRDRCRWAKDVDTEADPPEEWPPAPDALVQAVLLLTARYLQRRLSPDGLVGMGELGMMRVSSIDRDVESLTRPFRQVVFG